jgi:hypothetical protein
MALAASAIVMGMQTAQAGFAQLDSSSFTWQYEMNVMPSEADLNGDVVYDFTQGGSATIGVAGGILSADTTAGDGYLISGNVWSGNFSKAEGYTVEARVKVGSQVAGKAGATSIDVGVAGSPAAEMAIGTNSVTWIGVPGSPTVRTVLGATTDNTSDFHNYRISQIAGTDTFHVWRDNVRLTSSPIDAGQGVWDMLYFVDGGGAFAGTCQYDYVRFTAGNYAPVGESVPEPSSMLLLASAVAGLLAYAWRKRR